MGLRVLTRKVKIDLLTDDSDVCEMLFEQKRTQHACRLFLDKLRKERGLTRRQMSSFAWALHRGQIEKGFHYSRRSFYGQIRRTLMTLGLIAIQQRLVQAEDFDLRRDYLTDKYVPVRQPITHRPPDGLNLVRLTWIICKKWNREFLKEG